MYKHIAFAVAALAATGNCQAKSWQYFIDNGGNYTTRLAPGHGLSVDGAGGIFVKTMDTQFGPAPEFSHLYAFAPGGGMAWPWSALARPWAASDPQFESLGFHSNAGYRVAWYGAGEAGVTADLIVLFEPHNPSQVGQLQLPRQNDIRVLGAASDGQGGLLLLRSGNASTLPMLQRLSLSSGMPQLQWELPVADCNFGTIAVSIEDVDFALDPKSSTIHLLGHCNTGIVGFGNSFVQSIDLDGALLSQQRFDPHLWGFTLLARHKVGDGAWLYEYTDTNGGPGMLQLADVQHGLYPLFWPQGTGEIAVDSLGRSALIRARDVAAPAHYLVADLVRAPDSGLFGISNPQQYRGLSSYAGYGMRWSADSQGRRAAVWRIKPLGTPGELIVAGFAGGSEPHWLRSIGVIDADALPQLRLEPAADEFVLAVDRTRQFSRGVWVEQFAADSADACQPPFDCLPVPFLPEQ